MTLRRVETGRSFSILSWAYICLILERITNGFSTIQEGIYATMAIHSSGS